MLGSTTAPGRPGARAGAPCRIAFHSTHSVGVPRVLFSRLNTQPMRTPVNASPIHLAIELLSRAVTGYGMVGSTKPNVDGAIGSGRTEEVPGDVSNGRGEIGIVGSPLDDRLLLDEGLILPVEIEPHLDRDRAMRVKPPFMV